MQAVAAEFPNGEVAYFGINFRESIAIVNDYVGDTGITAPVLLDNPDNGQSCPWMVPSDAQTLTEHFQFKTGDPSFDPPFPLQLVYDADGKLAYVARDHDPAALIAVLRSLVTP